MDRGDSYKRTRHCKAQMLMLASKLQVRFATWYIHIRVGPIDDAIVHRDGWQTSQCWIGIVIGEFGRHCPTIISHIFIKQMISFKVTYKRGIQIKPFSFNMRDTATQSSKTAKKSTSWSKEENKRPWDNTQSKCIIRIDCVHGRGCKSHGCLGL